MFEKIKYQPLDSPDSWQAQDPRPLQRVWQFQEYCMFFWRQKVVKIREKTKGGSRSIDRVRKRRRMAWMGRVSWQSELQSLRQSRSTEYMSSRHRVILQAELKSTALLQILQRTMMRLLMRTERKMYRQYAILKYRKTEVQRAVLKRISKLSRKGESVRKMRQVPAASEHAQYPTSVKISPFAASENCKGAGIDCTEQKKFSPCQYSSPTASSSTFSSSTTTTQLILYHFSSSFPFTSSMPHSLTTWNSTIDIPTCPKHPTKNAKFSRLTRCFLLRLFSYSMLSLSLPFSAFNQRQLTIARYRVAAAMRTATISAARSQQPRQSRQAMRQSSPLCI